MINALLCINTYAGRREYPCRVVGETPKRYRIEVCDSVTLPGNRILHPGIVKLVPKTAVKINSKQTSGNF